MVRRRWSSRDQLRLCGVLSGVCVSSAGIVYVRDTIRGGLCSYPVFNNAINSVFCRIEAGQTAAIIFLFVTMVVYLIGAIVCLKLWRHEAARRYRERYGLQVRARRRRRRRLCIPGIPTRLPVKLRNVNKSCSRAAFAQLRGWGVSGRSLNPTCLLCSFSDMNSRNFQEVKLLLLRIGELKKIIQVSF